MSSRKHEPRLVTMSDGPYYVVQWCDDPQVARHLAAAEYVLGDYGVDDGPPLYVPGAGWVEGPVPSPESRFDASGLVAREPGWYRWTPCNESSCYDGGGHRGHLQPCSGPGRSIWRGVEVR